MSELTAVPRATGSSGGSDGASRGGATEQSTPGGTQAARPLVTSDSSKETTPDQSASAGLGPGPGPGRPAPASSFSRPSDAGRPAFGDLKAGLPMPTKKSSSLAVTRTRWDDEKTILAVIPGHGSREVTISGWTHIDIALDISKAFGLTQQDFRQVTQTAAEQSLMLMDPDYNVPYQGFAVKDVVEGSTLYFLPHRLNDRSEEGRRLVTRLMTRHLEEEIAIMKREGLIPAPGEVLVAHRELEGDAADEVPRMGDADAGAGGVAYGEARNARNSVADAAALAEARRAAGRVNFDVPEGEGEGGREGTGDRRPSGNSMGKLSLQRSLAYLTSAIRNRGLPVGYDWRVFGPRRAFQDRVWAFVDDSGSSALAMWFALFMAALIILSTIAMVVETMHKYYNDEQDYTSAFFGIEAFCIGCFTLELLLRLVSCPTVYGYLSDWLNWIDIVAVLPFYLELFLANAVPGLQVVRVLRLSRTLRLAKVSKNSMRVLTSALLASTSPLVTLVTLLVVAMIVFASVIFFLERGRWNAQLQVWEAVRDFYCEVTATRAEAIDANTFNVEAELSKGCTFLRHTAPDNTTAVFGCYEPHKMFQNCQARYEVHQFQSIPDAMWFCIVTQTTVGYGDSFPKSWLAQIVAGLLQLSGVLTIALPVTVISGNFEAVYSEMRAEKQRQRLIDKKLRLLQEGKHIEEEERKRAQEDKSSGAFGKAMKRWATTAPSKGMSRLRTFATKHSMLRRAKKEPSDAQGKDGSLSRTTTQAKQNSSVLEAQGTVEDAPQMGLAEMARLHASLQRMRKKQLRGASNRTIGRDRTTSSVARRGADADESGGGPVMVERPRFQSMAAPATKDFD